MSKQKRVTSLILACVALLATWAAARAQENKSSNHQSTPAQEEENSRRFWPPNFRPEAAAPKPKPRPSNPNRVTHPSATTNPVETIAETSLGVTIWLLRSATEIKPTAQAQPVQGRPEQARGTQSQNTDEIARVLIRKKNGQRADEMVAERVGANTPFSIGQKLRLSIEVPRDGYLYVIDREQYADGTLSDPYLIFPTNPQSNENRVSAGRIIELPGQDEVFEVAQFTENGKKLAGEALTFIVSPRPLEGLPRAQAADEPILLPKAQVETWESKWGAQVDQLELPNGAGKYRTRSEQQAITQPGQKLSQDDPPPQTVFRVAAKPGNPLLVKLPLKIGK